MVHNRQAPEGGFSKMKRKALREAHARELRSPRNGDGWW
jgi:hypothetical protein